MAIKNASDLLVYAKTTSAEAQVTRVRVLTTDPIQVPDGGTTGTVKIDNITNDSGTIYDDISTAASTNTGSTVLTAISNVLTSATYDYVASAEQTDGNYKYRDFTNGAVGIVPTLSIKDGTATLNDNAIIIEIVTPGSSAIFDPVAYSTSASFSTNMDLRDVTNKDSDGWSESLGGLKSFEVSTDLLQSINPDVPLDGTDFFDKLKNRSLVDLSFSDRIRNIIRTNLTQSGVDNFTLLNGLSQTNVQADPFSNYTASLLTTGASTSNKALGYSVDATRLHRKKINFSLYVKGQGSTTQLDIGFSSQSTSFVGNNIKATVEGSGSATHLAGIYWRVTGLSTSTWTRISFQTDTINLSGSSTLSFYIYPGLYSAQDSDEIFTSSWQIELSPEATDYQDPTDITHWQGNALVSSVSFDAGVEDNLTCSATFTGTGNIYPNGLGSELIEDTGFDDPSYWNWSGGSAVVEDGYGKIITTSALAKIYKDLNLTPGDFYLLTYTVHTSTQGSLSIHDSWENGSEIDMEIPSAVGTYSVLLKPGDSNLEIKRTSGATTIWLSSISLKKVL
tara:strand:+ start:1745 stop:3430 length:1686 start_codon:yes stop_codon:yes gene_type:complete